MRDTRSIALLLAATVGICGLAVAGPTPAGVAPRSRARRDASWMVRPSITGSENGMPISMASAPASAIAMSTSVQCDPSPPVT